MHSLGSGTGQSRDLYLRTGSYEFKESQASNAIGVRPGFAHIARNYVDNSLQAGSSRRQRSSRTRARFRQIRQALFETELPPLP